MQHDHQCGKLRAPHLWIDDLGIVVVRARGRDNGSCYYYHSLAMLGFVCSRCYAGGHWGLLDLRIPHGRVPGTAPNSNSCGRGMWLMARGVLEYTYSHRGSTSAHDWSRSHGAPPRPAMETEMCHVCACASPGAGRESGFGWVHRFRALAGSSVTGESLLYATTRLIKASPPACTVAPHV
jgi:hypothetical protein